MNPPPDYLAERLAMWDRLKKEQDEWVARQKNESITVTLTDGKEVQGHSYKTTPYDIASGISKGKIFKNALLSYLGDCEILNTQTCNDSMQR